MDFTSYLLSPEDLPNPFAKASLFGREAPLEVEVGSGKGLFLQNATANCPEHDFLGIEIAYQYAKFTAYRLAKHGLTNGKMVCGDGTRIFTEQIPQDTLEAVHVYFPDPWWKKRHHKRRVLTAPFLSDVFRTLRPGGKLHFWTDVKEYFDNTLELIAAETQFSGPIDVPEKLPEHALDYRTHFERRTRLHEEPVYRAEFLKPE